MRCKDTANREQKAQTCLKIYAEMQRIFYKDTANRGKKDQTCLKIYTEMRRIFCKSVVQKLNYVPKICVFQNIFSSLHRQKYGVLAHLARARHWQCRGERFESAILHFTRVANL